MYRIACLIYSVIGISTSLWLTFRDKEMTNFYQMSQFFELEQSAKRTTLTTPSLTGGWSLMAPEINESLPDLHQAILFLGKNGRPDAAEPTAFIKFLPSKISLTAKAGEKIYLQPKPTGKGEIEFSPVHEPSRLWIECRPVRGDQNQLHVTVCLQPSQSEQGQQKPQTSSFVLTTTPRDDSDWEIGGLRVDPSFAIKQKMRRLGVDKFLAMHGGEEFADKADKDRIEFISPSGDSYHRYLAQGDILLWDGERWSSCGDFHGESTEVPLLEVQHVDDKLFSLVVWNVGGLQHQQINLVKMATSPLEFVELLKEIEFVGMHTWTKPIVCIGGERFILSPEDWIVHGKKGWEKMSSIQQLEDFLSGKIQSPLFIFDRIEKTDKNFVLKGHVFNAQRTLVESVSLPLKQTVHGDVSQSTEKPKNHCGGA